MRLASSILSFLVVSLSLSLAACGGDAASAPPDGPSPTVDAPPTPPAPASCTNHIKDGDETDVDCGGSCGATCAVAAHCDWHDDCADGGICAGDPVAHNAPEVTTCHARVAACTPGACGDGLCETMQTNLDPASPDSVVVAYCEPRAAFGASCRYSSDKDVRTCVDGAACVEDPRDPFSYTCVAANTPIGSACSEDTCVAGAFCDHSSFGASATCKPQKALGDACLNSVDCATGLACDEVTSTCAPRAPIGGSCYYGQDGRDECEPGAHCALPAGLACETWVDCGSQMDCCATPSGSECRAFDSHTHCAPPSGTCAAGEF